MKYPREKRDDVRKSYVYERLSLENISQRHNIAWRTAQKWRDEAKADGQDWDVARAASRMAAGGLGDLTHQFIEDFSLLMATTVQDLREQKGDPIETAEALARLARAYEQGMKSAGAVDPRIGRLSVALETMREFTKYLRRNSPETLGLLMQHLEPFGAHLTEVMTAT